MVLIVLKELIQPNGDLASYFNQNSDSKEISDIDEMMKIVDRIPQKSFSNIERKFLFFSNVIAFEWMNHQSIRNDSPLGKDVEIPQPPFARCPPLSYTWKIR
jgi:hypothetical protein